MPLSGLRVRLLLLVLVAVVPGFALFLYAASAQRRLLDEDAVDQVVGAARLAAGQQERSVEGVRGLLAAFAQNPAVLGRDGPGCGEAARRLRRVLPHLSNIGASAPDGGVFCNSVDVPAPIRIEDRRYFRRALESGAFAVGEYQVSRSRGVPALNFGFPARDEAGRLQAVVFAGLDLSSIQAQLDALPLGEAASVIVDHAGVVLAARPAGAYPAGAPLDPSVLERIRGAPADVAEIRDAGGVGRLWAFRAVESPGGEPAMWVATGIPTASVRGPVDRIIGRTLLGYALVSVLALLAAGVVANLVLVRKLDAVIAAARRLSAGDYSARTGVARARGGGELDELIRTFDEMAGSLEALTRQNRLILDSAGEGIFGVDRDQRLTFVNPAACRMLGRQAADMLGQRSHDLFHHTRADGTGHPAADCPILATLADGQARHVADDVFQREDGGSLRVDYLATPLVDRGAAAGAVVTFRDVGERRRLEEQLRQAQKMEAVGQLAGGVAHDFNNLLTAILTAGRFAREALPAENPVRADVEEVLHAAERAATLTRQLLAFSRRQMLEPRVLDLEETVRSVEKMLRRLIGEHIALETRVAPGLGRVRADPGLVEQVIINLAVNARDAMPSGGRMVLDLANADPLDPQIAADAGLPQGPLVVLSLSDTGVGMDAETLSHAFDPFFTTKPAGTGTGLGLSTVYGIVTQSGGAVRVRSAPGQGTTFRVFLPRCDEPLLPAQAAGDAVPARGTETVLVVEDDATLRGLALRVLSEAGYDVIEAPGPAAALAAVDGREGSIRLLVSDVILAEASGPEVARALAGRIPGLRVLFMSGYTAGHLGAEFAQVPGQAFLSKPFTPDALLRKVREVLDAPAG
jgi:PAS domain S-box-containing protein